MAALAASGVQCLTLYRTNGRVKPHSSPASCHDGTDAMVHRRTHLVSEFSKSSRSYEWPVVVSVAKNNGQYRTVVCIIRKTAIHNKLETCIHGGALGFGGQHHICINGNIGATHVSPTQPRHGAPAVVIECFLFQHTPVCTNLRSTLVQASPSDS
jgi:hypothetical protein